jgi:NAD(P)-dependent dehydrogenase (short-subunit alcohol dehydrogenase family)
VSGRLAGKVAVVTGGASGMGRSTVDVFLAEGARVVVADLNERTGAETLAAAAEAGHGDAVRFVQVDVADEADVEAMVDVAVTELGGLDVMFNNAGFAGAVGPITDISLGDWNETIGVLLNGVFLGTKHAARAMQQLGTGGSIINTSSVAGISGGKGPQAYTAAKHAVIGLTRATSIELAPKLIRVNAICPGAINTPLINFGAEGEAGDRLDKAQPWPRHGRGDDIARAALYLASDDSEFVTGQSIVVDGGLTVGDTNGRARSKRMKQLEGYTGITRGSTGRPPEFRPVAD